MYCARLTGTCHGTCILLLSRWSGTFYCCVHQTHLECLLLKSYFFCFFWPQKPVPFEVPVVSDFSWDPHKQHVVIVLFDHLLTIGFKGFLTPRLNYFLQFSSCGPWRVFSHSNSPSHRALGRYRHTSSSRQFRNISCWLEIIHYCPDVGNGNFHCSSSFLKAISLICDAQLSFAAL